MAESDSSIAENLAAVRARIALAAERADRDPATITLVAVSKTFPAEAVVAAHAAGQRIFGENRVQEALAKAEAVRALGCADVDWHLIGTLQSNKARVAASLFAMIQSVDSLRLAQALARRAERTIPVLIEVNAGGEASKAGFTLDEAPRAVAEIRALATLDVRGLMTVAPPTADPDAVRPVFRALAELGRRLELPDLSMGMSSDYGVAIEEGATIVRVGTAIFGGRAAAARSDAR